MTRMDVTRRKLEKNSFAARFTTSYETCHVTFCQTTLARHAIPEKEVTEDIEVALEKKLSERKNLELIADLQAHPCPQWNTIA